MENSTGSITPFVTGVLPKEKYSDVNELARDLASVLRIDQDRIVVDLIALESLKGEQGEEGPRGLKGDSGPAGPTGPAGIPGFGGIIEYQVLNPVDDVFNWIVTGGISSHYNATLIFTGAKSLAITGAVNGMSGTLIVHQHPDGPVGTLALPANSRFPGGTPPVVTPTTNAIDIYQWIFNGFDFYWTFDQNFLP